MVKLTKKDFKAIAEIIKKRSFTEQQDGNIFMDAEPFIFSLCEYLATTNTQFKRDEFLKACGLEVE